MTVYRWAEEKDYKNVIEFANHAFRPDEWTFDFEKDTAPTSFFPRILPKLYQNVRTAPCHLLALNDEDMIVGMVGSFPMIMHVGDMALNVMGIGTVSTHPDARGEGHMKKLMDDSMDNALRQHADMLLLGGMRQRYGHWGFELAGINTQFSFNKHNMLHTFGKDASFGYYFRRLTEKDLDYITRERLLRTSALSYVEHERELEFAILSSMGTIPYVILHRDESSEESFAGSFMYEPEAGRIQDLRLVNEENAGKLINDLLKDGRFGKASQGERTLIADHIAPYDKTIIRELSVLAEDISISSACMMKIMNYRNVLLAYLKAALAYKKLADGKVVIAFENGEKLKIKVKDGKAEVEPTDKKPLLTLNEREAINLFFNPAAFTADFGSLMPAEARSWFPLGFMWYMSDEV